jgi:hypothetical protein
MYKSFFGVARRSIVRCPSDAGKFCVFFAQHLIEKRHPGLWEGPFFIARKTLSDNVIERRRGASPCVALSGWMDRTRCCAQV